MHLPRKGEVELRFSLHLFDLRRRQTSFLLRILASKRLNEAALIVRNLQTIANTVLLLELCVLLETEDSLPLKPSQALRVSAGGRVASRIIPYLFHECGARLRARVRLELGTGHPLRPGFFVWPHLHYLRSFNILVLVHV